MITDDSGSTAPLRDELYELMRELQPVADRLGCAARAGCRFRGARPAALRTNGSGPSSPAVAGSATSLMPWSQSSRRIALSSRERPRMRAVISGAELDSFLEAHLAELIAFRRDLHAHPEIGYHEHRTTRQIARRLAAAGLRPVVLPKGTGLIVDIGRRATGRSSRCAPTSTRCRSATRRTSPTGPPCAGVCHACGHDVHTAILVGTGLFLARRAAAGQLPRPGPADLPARRGGAGRRARRAGGRRHRVRRPDLRAALRPPARRGQDRHPGRPDHRRLRQDHGPGRRARAGTPPGRT